MPTRNIIEQSHPVLPMALASLEPAARKHLVRKLFTLASDGGIANPVVSRCLGAVLGGGSLTAFDRTSLVQAAETLDSLASELENRGVDKSTWFPSCSQARIATALMVASEGLTDEHLYDIVYELAFSFVDGLWFYDRVQSEIDRMT